MAIPEHEFMKSHNEILAAASIHCYFCGWSAWKDGKESMAFYYYLKELKK
jgi:hypothetical protein